MMRHYRLVCDRCHAFRRFVAPGDAAAPPSLRAHPALGEFVVEHEDCRPPLRVTGADDPALEAYREHYEEA
jgi:hypothetical protein